MSYGGPPRKNVGPTQGWRGGPPSAPGPGTRIDAGLPREDARERASRLPADEAQADAERVARRTGQKKRDG